MAQAIKSWYSPILGWRWHATKDEGGGGWFGYVEGDVGEWGTWSDEELATAKAVEIEPGTVPN